MRRVERNAESGIPNLSFPLTSHTSLRLRGATRAHNPSRLLPLVWAVGAHLSSALVMLVCGSAGPAAAVLLLTTGI